MRAKSPATSAPLDRQFDMVSLYRTRIPDQQVGVVREEGPGVDPEARCGHQGLQAADEIRPVGVILEDAPALESPHHHVVEGIGRRFRAKGGTEGSGRSAEAHPRGVGAAWQSGG